MNNTSLSLVTIVLMVIGPLLVSSERTFNSRFAPINMVFLVVFSLVVFSNAQQTLSIFLPYFKNMNHTTDVAFHVPRHAMIVDSPAFKVGKKLNDLLNKTKQYTFDERCESGMPLSIAWHQYAPYTTMYRSTYKGNSGFTVSGMFPDILSQMLRSCCHPNSTVAFGKLLRSGRHGEDSFAKNDPFDMTFPLFGYDGFGNSFRGHPFIPLVRAPRVIILVHDGRTQTRTNIMVNTIVNAWPMLVFIMVTASLSGIIIWFLDHTYNPDEFPPPFLRGAWEGFWWALVTMTTVGYGDRSPKSALGRVFCILWIITGVIIVSIFTALVTASLSASTYPNFKIHGSKIGAVNGSEEFRLGVTMNADMKVYSNVMQITDDLLKHHIDAALVDNYVITYFLHFIRDEPIRVEQYIEHPITYGVVLSKNSSRLEKCMRQYTADYPHEIFASIADKLTPLKNPTDDVSQQVKAAEALFYQETVFTTMMYAGLGAVGTLFLAGIIWEFAIRRPRQRSQRSIFGPKIKFNSTDETAMLQVTDTSLTARLDDMISEYQQFHDSWIENLKRFRDKTSNGNEMPANNGPIKDSTV